MTSDSANRQRIEMKVHLSGSLTSSLGTEVHRLLEQIRSDEGGEPSSQVRGELQDRTSARSVWVIDHHEMSLTKPSETVLALSRSDEISAFKANDAPPVDNWAVQMAKFSTTATP